jgi:eukaryotic-like serine/threonine-protein kinase
VRPHERDGIPVALRRPIKIGKYEVVDLVGKGGMGVVYKASDPHLGRAVAIKMMTTVDYVDNPDLLQRFYREAQSTGNLHHRNIVTVYELGDQDGSPYLVMEYLEGESLDAIISSRRSLNLLEKINFIADVCDGLAYAHQKSIVHRDIKPGNIMVLKDGGVKIVDFGIAHIGDRTVTRTGQLLGSLSYMSPEQISGKQVDSRTDIFSLGVVLYQLLTLNLPFEGETPAATLLKIIHERPRPLTDFLDSFPRELEDIVLRALAKDREDRYPTVQDLAFDLAQVKERVQQEILQQHLHEAESLLSREELPEAREQLLRVLKLDRHNSRAMELMRSTQQRIQQQELGAQVRQLRDEAEEAYQREHFVLALDLVHRALDLHATDADLQRFRTTIQQAKSRAEELQRALQRAESTFQQGELDSAKQAIEEALALAPEDVHAKSLYRSIQLDWTEREQRLQVHRLIEEARKEIASRHFTQALEVLRRAEEIDPDAPHLQALITATHSAREQEQRRRELESLKREIETDLDRDDFGAACTRAESALQQFPGDRGLQKLKELANKQRALSERKQFIDEQVTQARRLLEAGRTEEALQLLQSAQQKVAGNQHLESLLVIVRETLARQRVEAHKAEYLRRAKDFLRRENYSEAIQTLQAAQSELGESVEIDDLLQFTVEQLNAQRTRQIAEAAAETAHALIKDQDYGKAVEVLEAALSAAPDEELRIILMQARQGAADCQKLLQDALANAKSMMQGQRPTEALKYLEGQPASFARETRFIELKERAREASTRLKSIEQTLEKARLFLARDELEPGRAVLNECIRTHGRTAELDKLSAEFDEREQQEKQREKRKEEQRRLQQAAQKRAEEVAEQQRKQKVQEEAARRLEEQKRAEEQNERQRREKEEERHSKELERKDKVVQVSSSAERHAPKEYAIDVGRDAAKTGEKPRSAPVPAGNRDATGKKLSVLPAPREFAKPQLVRPANKSRARYVGVAGGVLAVLTLVVILWRTNHQPTGPTLLPIQVVTTPDGASVRVKETGQECVTPNCELKIAPGKYEVQIDLAGHQSVTRSLSVAAGTPTSLTVELSPFPTLQEPSSSASRSNEVARLILRAVQPGAEVFVDKQSKGKVGRRGTFSTELPAGDHELQLMAGNQAGGAIVRQFPAGGQVELRGSEFRHPEPIASMSHAPAEESDWQKVKDSHSIDDLEKFLKQYPSSAFHSQAQTQLENLYWAKAAGADSPAGYNEYLNKFPGGRYSQEAESDLARLDWRSVENTTDAAIVDGFLKKHPSGTYHDKAFLKLDELTWERTGQTDISSLRSYVQSFSNGRHIDEARKKIEELNHPSQVARSTQPRIAGTPPLDEKKAVLDVLARYQQAYEKHDLQELQRIWPGMTAQQIKGVGDFFQHASALTLSYRLIGDPEITGEHATVRFAQSLSYVASGKTGKDSAKVVMQLEKLPGPPANWQINSVR